MPPRRKRRRHLQSQRSGLQVQRFEPAQLARGALGQCAQLKAREIVGVGVLKRQPLPALADDADLQQLQLVKAAERRVAPQPSVQLQPAQPLAEHRGGRLEPALAQPLDD